ncbi:helix-turn-helix domain-containing protein [Siminovitchia sp. FSL W7-1587]|uniref:helix-turn-helix domain-containing protein n=1 Tax=Siminovitchia sp. FSL W7-1587 TaxID=2954699 RepID=UPI0030D59583
MDIAILILLCASTLFFILSFFQKNHTKELEKEVEELTMTLFKENQNMKKRISILEEELLMEKGFTDMSASQTPSTTALPNVNEILKNQVLALHDRGFTLEQIARQSSLSVQTVKQIVEAGKVSGGLHHG